MIFNSKSLLTGIAALLLFCATSAPAEQGLVGQYYSDFLVSEDGVISFDEADLSMTRVDPTIDFWGGSCSYFWNAISPVDHYGVRWTGYLRIDEAGEYGFGTISDDGSTLHIDGELVVNNAEEQYFDWEDNIAEGSFTGLYPTDYGYPDSLTGPLYLEAGYHTIEVRFFEAMVYDGMEVWWLRPGQGESDIPYYGRTCDLDGPSRNPSTNWEIIPSSVLSTNVAAAPDQVPATPENPLCAAPNPFNPRTTISFDMMDSGPVTLRIHDISGKLVRTLLAGEVRGSGRNEVPWSGHDDQGRPCPSGAYFCRLETGARTEILGITLLK